MKRSWVRAGVSICLALGICVLAASEPRKNVVLIVGDDLGKQIGAYGDPAAKTPAIDRLAAEGTRFNRAYATTTTCSASRSVILTGLHNHANGQYGHAHTVGHFTTYASVQSLPKILGQAGYRTGVFEKLHVAPKDVYPFDVYFDGNELTGGRRNTVEMAERAGQWIAEEPDKPFFLYYSTYDPHGGPGRFGNFNDEPNPYPQVERVTFNPDDVVVPDWLDDNRGTRAQLADYYQAINRLDQGVATLYAFLEESGQLDNTLIILTSDHGPPFPGGKTTLYETGALVPLIIRDPKTTTAGRRATDAMVSLADITPTILDYCGIEPPVAKPVQPWPNDETPWPNKPPRPYTFHGRSFVEVLNNRDTAGWDEVFLSHTFHQVNMYDPMRALVQRRWKYIYNLDYHTPQFWAVTRYNPDRPLDQQKIGQRPLRPYLQRQAYQLFDLEADPLETNNLAYDPAHRERAESMHARVVEFMEKTGDHFDWGDKIKGVDYVTKLQKLDAALKEPTRE